MKEVYYVYLLLDPLNFYLPFYIGKGKDQRCYSHLSESMETSENKRKTKHIIHIRNNGHEPIVMKWIENIDEDMAYNIEMELIERFGRKGLDTSGILMNYNKGGPNPPVMVGADNPMFGKTRPKDVKDAISRAKKGRPAWNKGKPRPQSVKDAISRANKGRKDPYKGTRRSDDVRERMRLGWKKFKEQNPNHKFKGFSKESHSEETKAKISKANKGQIPWNKEKPMTEEAKKKALETKRRNKLIKNGR